MNHRIKQSITTLILDEPFFATLLLNLKIKEVSDPAGDRQGAQAHNCPTMQTNGTELHINPNFVHTLTDPEITFVLAHEVLHCALGHIHRRNSRDPQKWNEACDYVVNEQLNLHIEKTGAKTMRMPQGALYDTSYHGKTTEEIYNLLPAPDPEAENPCGKFTDPPKPESESEAEGNQSQITNHKSQILSEADWKIIGTQAVNSQKLKEKSDHGTTTSHLDRLIKQHTNPTIPWQELLQQYCDEVTRDNYTWTQPNPRYLHTGFILPSLRDTSLGNIVIAIDTSGSVPDRLLALFLAETQNLLDTAKPASITIVSCDHELQNPQTFHHGDDLTSYIPKGGGGTDFVPPFKYVTENNIDPLLMIYFTDGLGNFPDQAPHYPTLWLHHGRDVHYPFGTKINLPAA